MDFFIGMWRDVLAHMFCCLSFGFLFVIPLIVILSGIFALIHTVFKLFCLFSAAVKGIIKKNETDKM